MQTSKLRSVLCSATINKNVFRNVAGNSATIKENETTQVQQGKPWREIPGLKSLPVIGQLYHFLPGGSLYNATSMEFITKMHEMYGPISRVDGLFGAPPIILLLDPESSAQIFRGENWLPERPGFLSLDYYRSSYKKNKSEFGGLLTDHGEKWKKFRSLVNPALLQPKTIKLYSEILDEVAQDMINRMKSNRGDNNKIKNKLDIEMNLWALESIGVVALGDRLNCFDPNLPEDSPARKLIKVVHDFFVVSEDIDFKPSLWRYFSTPAFKRAMKTYKDQDNLTKYFVDEAIKKLKTKNVKEGEEKGVLEKLLELDETIAHIMASDMLFAGVDTTANTMIFTLYLLAANPEKQDKLREEVMSQADKRPYLKACIKESLRVLPVVVGNMRKTTKEYNLLGYNIPKGTFVSFSHELMSKIEAYYPKPEEFIPERWLVGKDDPLYYGNAHPFAHNPFGFGARSCIGRRIAELEIETLLVRLIQNFKIEWFGPPLKIKRTSLNYAAEPFNFIFKDTANTVISTLYLLAANPDKQDKLREEVISETEKQPYLKACIKESLRLLPVVSGNIRKTTKEYNLMGYHIPKGIFVTFGHELMSKMEAYYPRAEEYIPERWLVGKEDPLYYGNAHPFAHSPFGFGARSCIGRRIAELEIETLLVRMIQNFKIEWFGPPLNVKRTSLNYAAEPFNFIFKDA